MERKSIIRKMVRLKMQKLNYCKIKKNDVEIFNCLTIFII